MNKFCRSGFVIIGTLLVLGLMEFCHIVLVGLFSLLVTLTILAELMHAYRLKSFKTLANRYTFGYILTILAIFLNTTDNQIANTTSICVIVYYKGMFDYALMYLLGAYAFVRGGHLVFDLFGKGHSYETRCPMQGRLDFCWFFAWTLGIIFAIRVGPFIVIWLISLFMERVKGSGF